MSAFSRRYHSVSGLSSKMNRQAWRGLRTGWDRSDDTAATRRSD
jgi:hypothetical protein